jgi:hypothetical protein
MNHCKKLPESREALVILFNETKGFTDQMRTLQQMWARRDEMLGEIVQKGARDPVTERFLLEQLEAIRREVSKLRHPGNTFLRYLPANALTDLIEAFGEARAYKDQLARSHRPQGLSAAEVASGLEILDRLNKKIGERLRPFERLQQRIFERLSVPSPGATPSRSSIPADADQSHTPALAPPPGGVSQVLTSPPGPTGAPGLPPVICSQAAVARFLGRCATTARLMATLQEEGIIERSEPPGKRGGKFKVWFADPAEHQRALREISGKPSRRRPTRRKP